MAESKLERAWKYYNAADSLYAQRFAYLMVAQAMLVAGFSALYAAPKQHHVVEAAVAVLDWFSPELSGASARAWMTR